MTRSGRENALRLTGMAAGAWILFGLLSVTVMSPVIRLLTFGLMTGALVFVSLYEAHKKDRGWKGILLVMASGWAICGATIYAASRIAPKTEPHGPLMAAGNPTPATACAETELAGDSLLMIMGRSGVIGRGAGPFTPFRVGSCPALRLTRTNGGLLVNAFGYDSDNNLVYRIHDNVFAEVVGGFLTEHRPDRSTLTIGDDHGPKILQIRFLNKNAVEISGTFRCGDSAPVRINPNAVASRSGKGRLAQCRVLDGRAARGLALGGSGGG